MKRYEEKRINYLINNPIGLFLIRRRRSLRRTGAMAFVQANWQNHNELERGNPVRVIREELDR